MQYVQNGKKKNQTNPKEEKLSQEDIFEFLNGNKGKKFMPNDIMEFFNINKQSLLRALHQMKKYHEIEVIELEEKHSGRKSYYYMVK